MIWPSWAQEGSEKKPKLLLLKMCLGPVASTPPGAWAESSVPEGLKGNLHFKEILKRSEHVLKLGRPNPKSADNGPDNGH